MTVLERFKELVENSDAIVIDGSPYLSSWVHENDPENCHSDDIVFEASWTDGDCRYDCLLSKTAVENGRFKKTSFYCSDSRGYDTRIGFYLVENLLLENKEDR